MSAAVHASPFDLGPPAKKRKRFTRSSTGCQSCRLQRVKCPEGPHQADGRKIACKRCWETDVECQYPADGRSRRNKGQMHEERWERAVDGDSHWSMRGNLDGAGWTGDTEPGWDLESLKRSSESASMALAPESVLAPTTSIASSAQIASTSSPWTGDFCPVTDTPLSTITALPSSSFVQWWMAVSNPSPAKIIDTFSLASIVASDTKDVARPILSYFELHGCNEIVAASKPKHNWLFTQLFPRLFATLSTTPANLDSVQGLMREWLQACLVQISYVHRANVDADPGKAYLWKSETDKARQRANRALLRAKVRFPGGQWKTEEYLMGFFVKCMAEMLSANRLVIDDTTVFELPSDTSSSIYPILRDSIALYSTFDHAGRPFSAGQQRQAHFVMPECGPGWVEEFVGFSRQTVIRLGEVSSLVWDRCALLQSGSADGLAVRLLQAQAEQALVDLGNGWDWAGHEDDVGRSNRIRKGNAVMRLALRAIILCEILEVDLDDPRLLSAQKAAIELVADTELSALGGFQWALTVLAIYTRDSSMREQLQDVIHHALSLSFGKGYVGTDEVLSLCWEVLDAIGSYHNGIAPWREALAASERSIFL